MVCCYLIYKFYHIYSSTSVGSLAHTVPMKGELTPSIQYTGYAHFTLAWVSQWDEGIALKYVKLSSQQI